ncbi:unnamed protein product [Cladocopium goreaui]|uniref:Phosphatase PSR1 n=1 Tax=Cladocopium goreaui TaxID=2562237 RepID=A0A9P1C8P2_9DINO|nr:unnamed protein product [Cladocopium goreaui]
MWRTGSTTVTVVNIFRVFRAPKPDGRMAAVPQAVGFKHSINSLLVVAIYIGGRFRSVGVGYLTLSECLLGGIEWGPELVDQLLRQEMVFAGPDARDMVCPKMGCLVLLGFLIVGSLLWLNTVAGIFMQQVDRSFEVTNVHQFKDPEFMAATKEILREFVLDLQDLDQDNSQSLNWRQISLVVTHHLELLSDLGIRSMAKARCSSSKSNGYSMLFRYRNHTVRIIRIHALPDFGQ